MFTGSVLENLLSDIGTGIVTVSATDQDRTHPNNAIQYSFSGMYRVSTDTVVRLCYTQINLFLLPS